MTIPSLTDEATLEFYKDKAPIYSATGKGGTSRFLHKFAKLLNTGSRILDLGCGGGRDSEELLRLGFDVESWDGSFAIAKQAEARIGRPVVVNRFDELDARSKFDAIWASASLLHVPKASLPQILTQIHRALKPDGLHFASYKSGGAQGRDSVGRYFNFLSRDQLLESYQRSGNWTIHSVQEYTGGGYDQGQQGPWIAVIASKSVLPIEKSSDV